MSEKNSCETCVHGNLCRIKFDNIGEATKMLAKIRSSNKYSEVQPLVLEWFASNCMQYSRKPDVPYGK